MRILVVEDEARLLELVRSGLAEEGHSVITSGNGNDALELARVYIETSRSMQFWFNEGLAFVGSPETVAANIRAQRERVGYDVLLLNHQFVDMPRDLYVKSMQLFGERVIPAFRA